VGGTAAPAPKPEEDEVAALRREIAELREAMEGQQRTMHPTVEEIRKLSLAMTRCGGSAYPMGGVGTGPSSHLTLVNPWTTRAAEVAQARPLSEQERRDLEERHAKVRAEMAEASRRAEAERERRFMDTQHELALVDEAARLAEARRPINRFRRWIKS
jgi:hypothetical protein